MQYGHFDLENKEYVITNPATPAPWANYLGDPEYGAIISNNASRLQLSLNQVLTEEFRVSALIRIWLFRADTSTSETTIRQITGQLHGSL